MLASGSTHVFENTKELRFSSYPLFQPQGEGSASVVQAVLENIFNAISALRSLKTVIWFYYPRHDPVGLADDFIRALGTIPTFHSFGDLCILSSPPQTLSLQPLSGLRSITCSSCWQGPQLVSEIASLLARCPELSCLHFNGASSVRFADLFAEVNKSGQSLPLKRLCSVGMSIIADDIAKSIRHFQSLESLSISRDLMDPAKVSDEIYIVLRQHNVPLKEMKVEINPFLIDYLASYSGLRDLQLVSHPFVNHPPMIVDKFYTKALPMHRETLEQLEITSEYASVWTKLPSIDHLQEVAKCQRLRGLKIWVDFGGVEPQRDYMAACDAWLAVGAQLPELTDMWISPSYVSLFRGPRVEAEDLLLAVLSRMRKETRKRFLVNNF
ncbi:hypothetical protein P691DRAFT_704183 [Macrolepiota fuliginosa MF-IS2]|uniref:F-box domain-containing protein n=1 Tax=Macrolepiota fuliginosa MF-IS2 TaxID=1400762 RepID=A0A9P5XFM3_9AGAR|nr:hypothetical protein P691DRAFT_704183 [Macrolepiota fuliginosa MF-IS2]